MVLRIKFIFLVVSFLIVLLIPPTSRAQFPPSVAQRLDEYGGDTLNPCPGGAKEVFYVYKDPASRHWWFCDPKGNRFIMNAIQDIDPYTHGSNGWPKNILRRYGGTRIDYDIMGHELRRMQSLGFNTIGEYSSILTFPFPTSAGNGNSTKLPLLKVINPSLGYKGRCGSPFHDTVSVTGPAFNGWRAAGFPDVWDPGWAQRAYCRDLRSPNMWLGPGTLKSFEDLDRSPYYLGTAIEDSDQIFGFKGTSRNRPPHNAWFVAIDPPRQVWSGRFGVVYSDPLMHAKQEFANWLQGKADPTPIKSISRDNNIVTITFSECGIAGVPPGPCNDTNYQPFGLNEIVNVSGAPEASLDGTGFKVVGQTANSIRYLQSGPNLNSQGGTVTSGLAYTVASLNAAWAANYSTFGSTGKSVTSETVVVGDAQASSFAHTLSHTPADVWSVEITVDGKGVGGDCPWFDNSPWQFKNVYPNDCGKGLAAGTGVIQGIPGESDVEGGTIDYASGMVRIDFRKPPRQGAIITANYSYGGWPRALTHGTGFLDEDGTNPWMPSLAVIRSADEQPQKETQLEKDFDGFLNHMAQRYFSVLVGAVHSAIPKHLVFGPDFMGPYDHAPVLVQAGQYLDVIILGDTEDENQFLLPRGSYDLAGKPIIFSEYIIANPDSATPWPCSQSQRGNGCLPTQQLRGETYNKRWKTYFDSKGSDGYGFMVGWDWWQLFDDKGERQNYGLETFLANLYDGAQATKKNGEAADYGDFISRVVPANLYWLQSNPGSE
ncbi:MAG TPA: hypothetical protein VGT03_03565 [Candidatus Acidoferrales bacterium]|nr:hypothetical protein [Candidatus Acidoferrales bacterium]